MICQRLRYFWCQQMSDVTDVLDIIYTTTQLLTTSISHVSTVSRMATPVNRVRHQKSRFIEPSTKRPRQTEQLQRYRSIYERMVCILTEQALAE